MKRELKKLAVEIREMKNQYKKVQRDGKYPSSYELILKQEEFRLKHIIHSLNKKKVEIEDISTEKILELGIETKPINPNKVYRVVNVFDIKRGVEKLREVKEDAA